MNIFNELIIVEFASVLAGPLTGTFFSELGATVVKIENKRTHGDVTRNWKTANENKDAISAYYSSANYKKTSLFLDVTNLDDRTEAYRWVQKADIVISNYKLGSDKKLGLDYDTLKAIKPNLIYGHISGYGQTSHRPAFDVVLQAETGFMSMNGSPESGPVKMPVALIDVLAAHQLKEGLLAALWKRERTGEGHFVSVSLYDAAIASLANQASNWLMNQHIPERIGSLHPNIAPYGDLCTTSDNQQIVLAIGTDRQFHHFCDVIGCDELKKDTNYLTNQLRVQNRDRLMNEIRKAMIKKSRTFWMDLFVKHNIPAGTILNLKEVFEQPEAKKLVLEETIENTCTKRVKTVVFDMQ